MEHKHKPMSAEPLTNTELKAAQEILEVLKGLPADEQDTILAVIGVMLAYQRKLIAREISQEVV